MGAYLSEPMTEKTSKDEQSDQLSYGASSMQGWRVSQEDAHNCIIDFDTDTSFFAVYDGHGGAEVATYCSMNLPDCLRSMSDYKKGSLGKALENSFLEFDASLTKPEVITELKQIAGLPDSDDESVEDARMLHEEASLPLDEVLARYETSGIKKVAPHVSSDYEKPKSPMLRGKKAPSTTDLNGLPGTSKCTDVTKETSDTATVNGEVDAKCEEAISKKESKLEDKVAISKSESKDNQSETSGSKSESKENQSEASESKLNPKDSKSDSVESASPSNSKEPDSKESETDSKPSDSAKPKPSDSTKPKPSDSAKLKPSDSAKPKPSGSTKSKPSDSANPKADDSAKPKADDSARPKPSDSAKPEAEDDSEEPSGNSEKVKEKEDLVQPGCSSEGGKKRSKKKGNYAVVAKSSSSDEDDDSDDVDEEYSTDHDSSAGASGSEDDEDKDDDEDDSDDDDDDEEESDDDDEDSDMCGMVRTGGEEEPGADSGCTAVVALLNGDQLYVANAGDSRCVVSRGGKAINMSFDHKPEDKVERRRITKAGGKVTLDGRVNGGLNLSRAIGDHAYKSNKDLSPREQMITALPDIQTLIIDPKEDKFMVLACDGIWNHLSSQDVVDFVNERLSDDKKLSSICEELFDHCLAPDTSGDGTGCDNMTAIIVKFHNLKKQGTKRQSDDSDVCQGQDSLDSKKLKVDDNLA